MKSRLAIRGIQKAAMLVLILSFFFQAPLMLKTAASDADSSLKEELKLLREQNALLQQQIQKQGGELESLSKKVHVLETAKTAGDNDSAGGADAAPMKSGVNFGKVNLGAEGGVGFFSTGSEGLAPHSNFRVDEARLFIEAPIWNDVYFYSDLELSTREDNSTQLQLGELYLDFENASQLWGKDSQLNIRAGRLNTPFGEEYLNRYAMENPLISHSLADIWGIDPGVELYGALGRFSYVVAAQNGSGKNGVQDYDGDKSVAGKLSFDPDSHWQFSESGMRTGNLDAHQDFLSALWFGNGFFRSIGGPNTTKFHADLVEGDVAARWKSGHASAFGGYARYDDNDPSAKNLRDIFYYSAELEQDLPQKFFVASRFSQIFSRNGYPIVGFGDFKHYFFQSQTTEIWRFSLGLGYRFSDRLALKVEYSLERGSAVGGTHRNKEDFLGTEAVFKF